MKLYITKEAFDGYKMRENFSFCVDEKGIIVWVGDKDSCPHKDAKIIDLTSKFVMPGIIDCHVHLFPSEQEFCASKEVNDGYLTILALENLKKLLTSGIVACRDLGSLDGLAISIDKAQKMGKLTKLPKVIASGKSLCATGGHGWEMSYECDGAEKFVWGTRQVIKDGASVVKIMTTGGVNSPGEEEGPPEVTLDEIKAVVREAHRRGRKVGVHSHGLTAIRDCVVGGVDSIEHGVFLNEEVMDIMLEKGTFLVPTLSAPYYATQEGIKAEPDNPDHKKSEAIISTHNAAVKKCVEKGVNVAMGTDAGAPFDPYERSIFELQLLKNVGLTAEEVLKCATSNGAKLLDLDNLGSLEVGKEASFLTFGASLIKDMSNIDNDRNVYLKGERVI